MEFEDDAYVLTARVHGETGAIVELLTRDHGKWAAHVAGGASRRMKPFLQAGARVTASYHSRVSDQLGSAKLEAVGEGPSSLFDDALALAGLASAAAVVAGALNEREPHAEIFHGFEALVGALGVRGRLAGGDGALRMRAAAGAGLRAGPVPVRGDRFARRPDLGQSPQRPGGEPRRRRTLPRPPPAPAALPALGPGGPGAGRRGRGASTSPAGSCATSSSAP